MQFSLHSAGNQFYGLTSVSKRRFVHVTLASLTKSVKKCFTVDFLSSTNLHDVFDCLISFTCSKTPVKMETIIVVIRLVEYLNWNIDLTTLAECNHGTAGMDSSFQRNTSAHSWACSLIMQNLKCNFSETKIQQSNQFETLKPAISPLNFNIKLHDSVCRENPKKTCIFTRVCVYGNCSDKTQSWSIWMVVQSTLIRGARELREEPVSHFCEKSETLIGVKCFQLRGSLQKFLLNIGWMVYLALIRLQPGICNQVGGWPIWNFYCEQSWGLHPKVKPLLMTLTDCNYFVQIWSFSS